MVVVGLGSIQDFLDKHAGCKEEVAELIRDLTKSTFATPQDLKSRFPAAKVISGRIVVFKIRGNRYRLTAMFAYNTQIVSLQALETHEEYDDRRFR